ncbi:MAG: alpha/beta hydrolase [Cyclobacteriaceae bacterium]|nr:alpha/beta hydrolase [Cyclobacteriaceae bacterium]
MQEYSRRKSASYLNLVRELPLHKVTVNAKTWTYIKTGNGESAILFIRGMGANSDIWWQQMAAFDMRYQVVSIDYPYEEDSQFLADGINLILSKLKIAKINIVANSYGGCLAQWFAEKYPERVRSLVLANTYLPCYDVVSKYNKLLSILNYIPNWVMVKVFNKINADAMKRELRNWHVATYMENKSARSVNKKELLAVSTSLKLAPDFKAFLLKDIPILIINSLDDRILEDIYRSKIIAAYPSAGTHTFKYGGHFPYLVNPSEFNEAIGDFMHKVESVKSQLPMDPTNNPLSPVMQH